MNYHESYEGLLRLGLVPIPLHPRSKRPIETQWSQKPLTRERLDELTASKNINLGILLGEPGNGVVDVDLDDPIARAIGHLFLPETDRVFGRPDHPRSHFLYKAEAGKQETIIRFKDPADKTSVLLELRGTGHQTMVPPSFYDEQTQAVWSKTGPLGQTSWTELVRAGGQIAARAYLGKHWYDWWGSIHDVVLALSGGLLRAGWSVDDIRSLIEVPLALNKDTAPNMQLRAVGDTAKKLAAGEEVTGWRTLSTLWSRNEVDTFRSWLGIEIIGTDFQRSDTYNADLFADMYGEDVSFHSDEGQWYLWNGSVWEKDTKKQVLNLAADVGTRILTEAARLQDEEERKARSKWGIATRSMAKIRAMLDKAEAHEDIVTNAYDWNRDPMLVGLPNGTMNLQTLSLQPPSRDDRINRQFHAPFDVNAEAPVWGRFLEEIQPDPAMREYLQRLVGYWMTGSSREQLFWVLYGPSAGNGKSSFITALSYVMGSYAQRSNIKSFLKSSSSGSPRQDLVLMDGCHLLSASEPPTTAEFDTSVLKDFTGSDPIRARGLYWRHEIEFVPKASLVIPSNHLPRADAFDEGLWRRIEVIPFLVSIPVHQRDKRLTEKFQAEASGILNWALEGVNNYHLKGLGEKPGPVERYTAEYRESNNSVDGFVEDETIFDGDPSSFVGRHEIYQSYIRWCRDSRVSPAALGDFRARLEARGVVEVKRRGKRGFKGIRLVEPLKDALSIVGGADVL